MPVVAYLESRKCTGPRKGENCDQKNSKFMKCGICPHAIKTTQDKINTRAIPKAKVPIESREDDTVLFAEFCTPVGLWATMKISRGNIDYTEERPKKVW